MPEGHLIHFYAREHARLAGHRVAASSPQGRFAPEAKELDGRRLDAAEAYGKHLFHAYGGRVLHVHLGRTGTFLWFDPPAPEPRASVRLRLDTEIATLDLIAPLVCELGPPSLRDEVVATLGPDPLRDDADVGRVREAFASSRRAVGDLLLDQRVVSGVGNVLRSEALYLAGVDPRTPAPDVAFEPLWAILIPMMERAAGLGRIETTTGTARSAGRTRWVYKQRTCARCGAPIETPVVGGRAMYVCPREQARPSVEISSSGRRP